MANLSRTGFEKEVDGMSNKQSKRPSVPPPHEAVRAGKAILDVNPELTREVQVLITACIEWGYSLCQADTRVNLDEAIKLTLEER